MRVLSAIRPMMLAALFACLATSAAAAQELPKRTRVWAAVGVGAGMPTSGGDGIANMAQLVYQRRPHHAALRGLVLHDLDRGTNEIGELSVLYGRTDLFGRGNIAIAAGLSGVAFDTCPDDDDACFTIGVPLVAETALSGKYVGAGVQAFANVNQKASYAGVVLFLQAGRLR